MKKEHQFRPGLMHYQLEQADQKITTLKLYRHDIHWVHEDWHLLGSIEDTRCEYQPVQHCKQKKKY